MASLSLAIQVEEQTWSQESAGRSRPPTSYTWTDDAWLLVAGFEDSAAADYATYAWRLGNKNVAIAADSHISRCLEAPARALPLPASSATGWDAADLKDQITDLIVFLNGRFTQRDRQDFDELLASAYGQQIGFIGIVSTFRAHLGDIAAVEAESYLLDRVKKLRCRTVVFRPGLVLSQSSRTGVFLRRFSFLWPLVPARLQSCFLDGDDLFAAIEKERLSSGSRGFRRFSILGANRPWKVMLAEHGASGFWRTCLSILSAFLSILFLGHVAALLLSLLARYWPLLKCWNVSTLRPRSFAELLTIYNKYNWQHVKMVGYNNGVNHFGQRYPGKTIVSTVHCNRAVLVGDKVLKVDCGTTVRKSLDVLAEAGLELPVVPNYSYVCLGTAFFIPIHGSASDFSTVAETIGRVLLYDPIKDQFLTAASSEPDFRDHVYNLRADILLLRLYLEARPKARYFVRKEVLKKPDSATLIAALRDDRATNVEIRKSSASSDEVSICRYYKNPGDSPAQALELPRDGLGRLWDRLEENCVTSFLMHALTRHFAYHLELFLTANEFAKFWASHGALPLRKLQFRYIRRDGLPHSPFRDHDCVSVDLFMFRRHKRRFQTFLKKNFAVVRTNPGKHSR
jgi:hypothetical protein